MEIRKRVCIVDTLYALFLYLVMSNREEIDNTTFYVGSTIPESTSIYLPNVIRINIKTGKIGSFFLRCWNRLRMLNITLSIRKCDIFAQDHITFAPYIIGHNRYTLLEDAPGCWAVVDKIEFLRPNPYKSAFKRIVYSTIISPTFKNTFGTNSICTNRIYTRKVDGELNILCGVNKTYYDLEEEWNSSSETKRKLIMNVFNISEEMLHTAFDAKVILFTQPFMEDCGLTADEYIAVYKPYIDRYADKGIIVKKHPRDKFDFSIHMPQVKMLDTIAPMQVLSIMGMHFDVAITVSSTAVTSLGSETNTIWIGTKCNAKIFNVYGDDSILKSSLKLTT